MEEVTDEVGGVGGPEEIRQVQPLDECGVPGHFGSSAKGSPCAGRVDAQAQQVLVQQE